MTNCHFCNKKITGESFDHIISVCHPTTTYDTVKICFKCHHLPHNNVESKETLIK